MTTVRKCKICKKVLSSYNSEEYCFVHHRDGQRIKDKEKDDWMFGDKRVRQKARYRQEKREKNNG